MTALGKTMRAVVKALWDDARSRPKQLDADVDDTTDERHKGKCYGQAALWRDIERRIQDGLQIHDIHWLFGDDTSDDSLKNEILRQWAACSTEVQRTHVLHQIKGARHEIRAEYLHAEPELRDTIAALESLLTSIMRGTYSIGACDITRSSSEGRDMYSQREAPLVGLAGHIAALVYLRAEQGRRAHAEWGGWHVHEQRVLDAMQARKLPATPGSGFTGYVQPIDPVSVDCRICKATIGVKCIQPKVNE